jgi:hypothetical protein
MHLHHHNNDEELQKILNHQLVCIFILMLLLFLKTRGLADGKRCINTIFGVICAIIIIVTVSRQLCPTKDTAGSANADPQATQNNPLPSAATKTQQSTAGCLYRHQ